MKPATFRGEVLDGHKGAAVEVPFDPAQRLGTRAVSIAPSRRGHRVTATVNGRRFDSAVVARAKRFFLLLGADVLRGAAIGVGSTIEVSLEPFTHR